MQTRALVSAIWSALHPVAARAGDAFELAKAIEAVSDRLLPVFGTREDDAAVMAHAFREGWLRKDAVGDGGKGFGVWQEQCAAGKADVLTQARAWVGLLRAGAQACPRSPAAPLSGGCKAGRRVADVVWLEPSPFSIGIRPTPSDPSADLAARLSSGTANETGRLVSP